MISGRWIHTIISARESRGSINKRRTIGSSDGRIQEFQYLDRFWKDPTAFKEDRDDDFLKLDGIGGAKLVADKDKKVKATELVRFMIQIKKKHKEARAQYYFQGVSAGVSAAQKYKDSLCEQVSKWLALFV